MSPVVIAGSGLAGYTLARELRKLAPDRPITLVTADSGDLYSKPMLSNALAQGHTPQALVQGSARDQAEKLGIEIRSHCPISAILPGEHRLDTALGPLDYGTLVLALGARPSRPGFPGDELALSVNNLDDYARFRSRLDPGARVAILGGGLVGCEFANDLALAGHPVELVELADRPLARQIPPALSHRLQARLEALGVAWHCGRRVLGLMAQDGHYHLSLDDGRELAADLVLSAIGLTPATELARSAGLDVGRGIRVDAGLAASLPDIYALGDCAEVVPDGGADQGGLLLPYVLPLMQQARTLASTLAGTPARLSLPALPVAVKTPACPLVVCPPPAKATGSWHTERDDEAGAVHHYLDENGSLLGFALAGDACGQRRALAGKVPALLT